MFDTNVLLDWLLDRNTAKTRRIEQLIQQSDEIHVADVAIVEMVYVLERLYRFPRTIIANNVRQALNEPVLNCNRTMFGGAVNDYIEHPGLSFADCCLLHYAQIQRTLPLWTSDKKLANQGGGVAELLA